MTLPRDWRESLDVLTEAEVAQILRMSVVSVARRRKAGRLRTVGPPSEQPPRYAVAEIRHYLGEITSDPDPPEKPSAQRVRRSADPAVRRSVERVTKQMSQRRG